MNNCYRRHDEFINQLKEEQDRRAELEAEEKRQRKLELKKLKEEELERCKRINNDFRFSHRQVFYKLFLESI